MGSPLLNSANFFSQLISLQNQTHEYNEVASLFGKTMDRNRIQRIQRIQNLDLWEFFCRWVDSLSLFPPCLTLPDCRDGSTQSLAGFIFSYRQAVLLLPCLNFFYIDFISWVWLFPVCLSVNHVHTWCLRSSEGILSLGTTVYRSCEPLCGSCKSTECSQLSLQPLAGLYPPLCPQRVGKVFSGIHSVSTVGEALSLLGPKLHFGWDGAL